MKFSILIFAGALLLTRPQEENKDKLQEAVKGITKELLKEYVTFLASDDLEGRAMGSGGEEKAGVYITKVYEKAGLQPVGDLVNGKQGYFQSFSASGLKTRNTVAFIGGSDEKLKDEIVIIGAHHDHLGMRKSGKEKDRIFNGADDNASGVAAVMAIAKAFGESGLKPKRSILFITFSGHEVGMLGAQHYVKNPIFQLENTIAMINFDMLGRNSDEPVSIYGLGTESADLFEGIVKEASAKVEIKTRPLQSAFSGFADSDHVLFGAKKIPVMLFTSGVHADYHLVSDHVDKIEIEFMEKNVKLAAISLYNVANLIERPKFSETPKSQVDTPVTPKTRSLGVTADDITAEDYEKLGLDKDDGAVKVGEVKEKSVAETAGVKVGDFIIAVAGKKLNRKDPMGGIKEIISKIKPNQDISIEIVRGGEKKMLTVRWDK